MPCVRRVDPGGVTTRNYTQRPNLFNGFFVLLKQIFMGFYERMDSRSQGALGTGAGPDLRPFDRERCRRRHSNSISGSPWSPATIPQVSGSHRTSSWSSKNLIRWRRVSNSACTSAHRESAVGGAFSRVCTGVCSLDISRSSVASVGPV